MQITDNAMPQQKSSSSAGKLTLEAKHWSLDTETIALREIDFFVCSAEITALIGPNGAGKSTLLRAIAGDFDQLSSWKKQSGVLQWLGSSMVEKRPAAFRKKVAVMTQHSQLNFPFLVKEVVAMGRMPHDTGADVDTKVVDIIVQALDLLSLADKAYTSLSGGEKQRVQFARALAQLVTEPLDRLDAADFSDKLLILDEPFSAQDLKYQALMKKCLAKLKQNGLAVIVVLHDISIAFELADRTIGLQAGRQVFYGDSADVLQEKNLSSLFDVSVRSANLNDQRLFTIS